MRKKCPKCQQAMVTIKSYMMTTGAMKVCDAKYHCPSCLLEIEYTKEELEKLQGK